MKIEQEEALNHVQPTPVSLRLLEEDNSIKSRAPLQNSYASSLSSLPIIPKEEPESSCNTCLIQRKIEGEGTTPGFQYRNTSISSETGICQYPLAVSVAQSSKGSTIRQRRSQKNDKVNNYNKNNSRKTSSSSSLSMKNPKMPQMNQILKVIEKKVKTPRIYSHYYRRKKLGMQTTKKSDIRITNEVLLFGNISIEGSYEDQSNHSPITAASRILSVCSSIKDNNNQNIELKLATTHCNQHINFKFLVDNFKKMSQPSSQGLSKALNEYQKLLQNRVFPHIQSTNRAMSDSDEFCEEVARVFEKAETELRKKFQSKAQETGLYKYVIQRVNFTSKQLDTTSIGLSYGLLEKLEVNLSETDYHIHENMEKLIQFESVSSGEQRAGNAVEVVELITKQLRSIPSYQISLKTMNNIFIPAIATLEFIYPSDLLPEVPSWMHYTDFLGYFVKYTIISNDSPQNSQRNLNISDNVCEKKNTKLLQDQEEEHQNTAFSIKTQRNLEVQTFLEKFYPNKIFPSEANYSHSVNIKEKTLE